MLVFVQQCHQNGDIPHPFVSELVLEVHLQDLLGFFLGFYLFPDLLEEDGWVHIMLDLLS